ncbi:PilZ domain-containing protein [Haliangium ochraceum]|nr:PilZ domain-containing protein [Haliangium ochraceum]
MSRRYPRIRARLTVTVSRDDQGAPFVCHTRDISERGCFLDTAKMVPPGTRLLIALLDDLRGAAMEIAGEVARCLPPDAEGRGRGLGVRFDSPPDEWNLTVVGYHAEREKERRARRLKRTRLRVLVVGNQARQRGAMALYVTSGWDVRFAADLEGVEDALDGVRLDAIIAENDIAGTPWNQVLAAARRLQPEARRIVLRASPDHGPSTSLRPGDPPLFHHVVDREAGIEELLDALTLEPTQR